MPWKRLWRVEAWTPQGLWKVCCGNKTSEADPPHDLKETGKTGLHCSLVQFWCSHAHCRNFKWQTGVSIGPVCGYVYIYVMAFSSICNKMRCADIFLTSAVFPWTTLVGTNHCILEKLHKTCCFGGDLTQSIHHNYTCPFYCSLIYPIPWQESL